MMTDIGLKSAIKNLGDGAKLFMGDGSGLYIRRKKDSFYWQFQFKKADGRLTTKNLGKYPEVGIRAARIAVGGIRADIANGIYPDTRQTIRAQRLEFEVIAKEWYEVRTTVYSKQYRRNIYYYLFNHIIPALGKMSVASITTQDIYYFLKKETDKEHHTQAKLFLVTISNIFKFGQALGVIQNNPAEGVGNLIPSRVQVKHHNCILDEKRLGEVMRTLKECSHGTLMCSYCIRLMPYLFARSVELRGARWEEFNFEKRLWTIPAERMKAKREHVVPLSRQVIAILQEYKEKLDIVNEWVFPSIMSKKTHISAVSLIKMLRINGITTKETDVHGWRGTASTLLAEEGNFPSFLIEYSLAHKVGNDVLQAYRHGTMLQQRRVLMQWWADYLDALRDGKPKPISPYAVTDEGF